MITRVTYGRHNGAYNYCVFVVDEESDLESLPTSVTKGTSNGVTYDYCSVGSKAIVVNLRKLYMLNNANQWKMVINYAAGGGGGGTGEIQVEDDGDGNVSIL